MALTRLELSLDALIAERRLTWLEWFGARGRRLELTPPPTPARAWFDPTRVASALDAFAKWRARSGPRESVARLQWRAEAGQIVLEWLEPGEGRSWIAPSLDQPAPLALPMLARLVYAHDGTLSLCACDGLHLILQWPCCPLTATDADLPS